MTINLISDTITRPTKPMLDAMFQAKVGDDVFGEDLTVNQLQQKAAEMFNMEDALFCPSGTMTNQIALKLHTQPLDEIICDVDSHIYQAETGGYAFHSGASIALIHGENGKITPPQIEAQIRAGFDWQPLSKLVVLENSCNKGGGSYYTLDEIEDIYQTTKKRQLKLHLDGARIFNVLVETRENAQDYGQYFDTISICLSKGLGAPVGSLLLGSKDDIKKARRVRKVMGGGMRQAGYLAAAGIYALDHHIERLKNDNDRARVTGQILAKKDFVKYLKPVFTNIVIFELEAHVTCDMFLEELKNHHVLASAFGHQTIRLVFHLDISEKDFDTICQVLEKLHF